MGATWVDLLEPSPEALRAQAPCDPETALERLPAPPEHAGSGTPGGSAGSSIG